MLSIRLYRIGDVKGRKTVFMLSEFAALGRVGPIIDSPWRRPEIWHAPLPNGGTGQRPVGIHLRQAAIDNDLGN